MIRITKLIILNNTAKLMVDCFTSDKVVVVRVHRSVLWKFSGVLITHRVFSSVYPNYFIMLNFLLIFIVLLFSGSLVVLAFSNLKRSLFRSNIFNKNTIPQTITFDISKMNITKTNYKVNKGVVNTWRIDFELESGLKPLYIYIKQIDKILEAFWNDVIIEIPENSTIILQLVGHGIEHGYFNITPFLKTNKNEYNRILKVFTSEIETINEYYLSINIVGITFKYYILENKNMENDVSNNNNNNNVYYNQKRTLFTRVKDFISILSSGIVDVRSRIYTEKHWNFEAVRSLPNNNDYLSWGEFSKIGDDNFIINIPSKDYYYEIKYINTFSIVWISCKISADSPLAQAVEIFKVEDKIINEINNTFQRRYINNKNEVIYMEIFHDDKLVFKSRVVECNFINQSSKTKRYDKMKILTIDLETIIIGDVITPISISIFDGDLVWSYNINNFNNFKDIIAKAIKDIIRAKYNGWKVYLHNFSRFDSVFILNIIASISNKIKVLKRDSQFLNINIKYGDKDQYQLNFRDSYLLIPVKLKDLCLSFNVNEKKDIFPLKFVTIDNLNYEGDVPSIEIFFGISPDEYNEYVIRFKGVKWNIIKELEKYCELDCISLYNVLVSFNTLIWDRFQVDACSTVTLSSLAMKIYRHKFLRKGVKIPTITGGIFIDMSNAFTGGAVDVWKPHGFDVKRVDVNSLYPFVIISREFPVGIPIQFIGDYKLVSEYGSKLAIIEVEIETPLDLKHPVLIVKNDKGINIRPLGQWRGWYTSKELENAEKFGYKYKILRGYLFDSGRPFKEYVNHIYQIRLDNVKGTPLNLIAKLLLNSLFGRFGIKPLIDSTSIIDLIDLDNYIDSYLVKDVVHLEDDKCIVTYSLYSDPKDFYEGEQKTRKNISLPISIFTTSYGRIHITKYMNRDDLELYYSDTDSLDFKGDIDPADLGKDIGIIKTRGRIRWIYLPCS